LALIYLLVPTMLFGSLHADSRLPIAAAFLLIAMTNLRQIAPWRNIVVGLLALLFVLRIVSTVDDWRRADALYAEWVDAFRALPAGSILFSSGRHYEFQYPWTDPAYWRPPLGHVAALAAVVNTVLVPEMIMLPKQQPITYRAGAQRLNDMQKGFLEMAQNVVSFEDDAALRDLIARIRREVPASGVAHAGVYLSVLDKHHQSTPPNDTPVVARGSGFFILEIMQGP
jgi:hypothetical protein